MRARLLLSCSLVAIASLMLVLAARSSPASASDATITTTLHPGDNLIGWVEADAPTDHVFDQIPELQSIRSSSSGSTWFVHRRASGEARRGRLLEIGRGYWFHLVSERPIEWERRMSEHAADHQLGPGQHVVAWAGTDGVPFRHAMLAIDGAPSHAWLWDSRHQRIISWSARTRDLVSVSAPGVTGLGWRSLATAASMWKLRPGDALGITLGRPLTWIQPTGSLPVIRYVGDVREQARQFVVEDTRFVLTYFARRFGAEVNPDHLEIVVGLRADLFDVIDDGMPFFSYFRPPGGVPQSWNRSRIIISLENWFQLDGSSYAGTRRSGRGILLHEYFHALQFHLAPANFWSVPAWLTEGTAIEFVNEIAPSSLFAGPGDLARVREIGLRDRQAANHPHSIGAIALRLLTSSQGHDSVFIFWRSLATMERTRLAWERAFEHTFGRTVDHFSDEYRTWMDEQFAEVTGRIEFGGRMDSSQAAVEIEPVARAIPRTTTSVDSDGNYSALVHKGVAFRVKVHSVDTGCFAYLSERGTWRTREDSHVFVQADGGTRLPTVVGRPVGFICD